MSYQVLARKYRPQSFEALVGQEHVARALQNAITTERVAHAFLFTGIRGVGKTTAARLLAKALNCERGSRPDPCGECSNCVEIAGSRSLDVIEIDGASNRGIDSIRELNENVRYAPAKSRYRIYIIDEAHMVTREGFNALLKTLEEPPPRTKFIFATTAVDKFPDTIVSRCQRYDFRRISSAKIAEQLRAIAAREEVQVSHAAIHAIVREAEGSMRDAESLLDRLIAFSGADVREEHVSDVLGVADRSALHGVVAAVLASDPKAALERVGEIHDAGRDLERFSRDLLEHFRDLVVVKLYGSRGTLHDVPETELQDVRRESELRSLADLQRMFRIVLASDDEIRRAAFPRLVLEMMIVRLATLEPILPFGEVLERLQELEDRWTSGGPENAPAAAPAPVSGGAPERSKPRGSTVTAESSGNGARARGTWEEFLEFVRGKRITAYFTLSHARVIDRDDGRLRLGVAREAWAKELRAMQLMIEDYAAEFFGGETRISIELVEEAVVDPAPARNLAAETLENPAVKKAVEILGGHVREVRDLSRRPRGE